MHAVTFSELQAKFRVLRCFWQFVYVYYKLDFDFAFDLEIEIAFVCKVDYDFVLKNFDYNFNVVPKIVVDFMLD